MTWVLRLVIVAVAAFLIVFIVGFFVILAATHNGKTDALSLKQLQADPVLGAINSQQQIAHRSDNKGYCESGLVMQPFIQLNFTSTDQQAIQGAVATILHDHGWIEQPRAEDAQVKLAFEKSNAGYTETASLREYNPGQLTFELSSDAKKFATC